MRDFASNERIAHFFRAVRIPSEVATVYSAEQAAFSACRVLFRCGHGDDRELFRPYVGHPNSIENRPCYHDADRGFMDEFDIGPKLTGNTDSLRTAAGFCRSKPS